MKLLGFCIWDADVELWGSGLMDSGVGWSDFYGSKLDWVLPLLIGGLVEVVIERWIEIVIALLLFVKG